MLEEQARGQAHLWVPAEYTGGLLHCHREPVSAAALRHTHTHAHTLWHDLDHDQEEIYTYVTYPCQSVDFIHM